MSSEQAAAQLLPHLRAGEALAWSGRPDPKVRFAPIDAFLIPFSLFWCGFAIFWVIGASTASGPFGAIGLPFVAIGLYFVFGRFLVKSRRKRTTAYGLTSDRALIASGSTVRDMPIKGTPISIRKSRDGSHVSIVFGQVNQRAGFYGNTGMEMMARGVDPPFAFHDVPQPGSLLAALDRERSF